MKPNTPMKMTMISHITYWCRLSMSRASCEPGDWKYHAMAWAFAAAPRPARAAMMERSFDPFIFFFPDLVLQSLLQLGTEHPARLLVEVPPQLKPLSRLAQHDARALRFDAHASRIDLVARKAPALGHFDPQPAALERNALVIRRMARVQHERATQQQHFKPGKRQDQPRPRDRKPRSYGEHHDRERDEHASETGRRDRAVALEGQGEAAVLLPECQLPRRILRKSLESLRAHGGA